MSLPVFSPMQGFVPSSPEANDLSAGDVSTCGGYSRNHVNSPSVTQW